MNSKKFDQLVFVTKDTADKLNLRTRTRAQKTIDFKLRKSVSTFSVNPPLEPEKEKLLVHVLELDVNNSAFDMTQHNRIIEIFTPNYWENVETIN